MNSSESAQFLLELATRLGVADVAPGTMMGFQCLRVRGKFFASTNRDASSLIVKLPAARVTAAIAEGHGRAFAPNGRVFREWLEIPREQTARWASLLHEAYLFVVGGAS